ncbi:pirin family protein [Pseudonocardiaceae bacterium YIM PH 21723]|nr:pirin family protein [Pseudonocardiaceae bacterium YIM PH 21723]
MTLYESREVPLGGLRAITVHRTLPQRALSTVGAWCFLDVFGPDRHDMTVLPHPHIGLQTVTWPLVGEIRHKDSVGSEAVLRPGQLNLMTAGRGIAHSEFSLGELPQLHGLQFWVALPGDAAYVEPHFEQHLELPKAVYGDAEATVFMGTLGETTSPATTYSPLVGADVVLNGNSTVPLNAEWEHAVLVTEGSVTVNGEELPIGPLLYLAPGETSVTVAGDGRFALIGGQKYPHELVMWWNFVGRTHEEIVAARDDWQAQPNSRFGLVEGHDGQWIPAPPMPDVRLKPRQPH